MRKKSLQKSCKKEHRVENYTQMTLALNLLVKANHFFLKPEKRKVRTKFLRAFNTLAF